MVTNPLLDQVWIGTEYDPYQTEYIETQADNILQAVIDSINIWSSNNPNKVVYYIAECPTNKITLGLNYESHLKWISEIAKTCVYDDYYYGTNSYEWWVDSDYGIHIAERKEDLYTKDSPYDISGILVNNIESDDQVSLTKKESHNISNRLFGLGGDQGNDQLKVTVQDDESINIYGFRDELISDSKFTVESQFRDYLNSLLRIKKAPVYSYECTLRFLDFYNANLKIGDWVLIHQPEWNADTAIVRILEYNTNFETITLTVSNSSYSVEDKINEINAKIEDIAKYSQTKESPVNKDQPNGYAGLDANSKVIEDPANATATATASKIPISGTGGTLATGWIPDLSSIYTKSSSGSYAGDSTNNRAIAHGLGQIPKIVYIYRSDGISFYMHLISGWLTYIAGDTAYSITATTTTNFYVGADTTNYRANVSGNTYYWKAYL